MADSTSLGLRPVQSSVVNTLPSSQAADVQRQVLRAGVGNAPSGFDPPQSSSFSWSSFVNGAVRAWGDDMVVGATGFKPKSRSEAIGAAVGHIGGIAAGLLEAGGSAGGGAACMVLSDGACLPLAEPLVAAGTIHGAAVVAKSGKDFVDSLRRINASSSTRSSDGGSDKLANGGWINPNGSVAATGGEGGQAGHGWKGGTDPIGDELRKGRVRFSIPDNTQAKGYGAVEVNSLEAASEKNVRAAVKRVAGVKEKVLVSDRFNRRASFSSTDLKATDYNIWATKPLSGSLVEKSKLYVNSTPYEAPVKTGGLYRHEGD